MSTVTSEFNWMPPEWVDGQPKPPLPNNSPAAPTFTNPPDIDGHLALGPRINKLKAKYGNFKAKANRDAESKVEEDQHEPLKHVPHPDASFHHIDPGVYTKQEMDDFVAAIDLLDNLEGLSSKDGEVDQAFKEALPPLRRIRPLFDRTQGAAGLPKPKGMQRLKLVFENTLCQLTAVLGEINAALDDNKRDEYVAACNKYRELIEDLDNREPHSVVPGEKGYGKSVKWVYVKALVHGGKIKGAKLVAKWNPHISSSGIPIPHS